MSDKRKLIFVVAWAAVVLLLTGCMQNQNKCGCGEEPVESGAPAKT
ncbi:hypothetical protein [Paenibacillus ginsengarvi]|nr:hypothetical protein [Paenibacillus ginsengarvi]